MTKASTNAPSLNSQTLGGIWARGAATLAAGTVFIATVLPFLNHWNGSAKMFSTGSECRVRLIHQKVWRGQNSIFSVDRLPIGRTYRTGHKYTQE
jgi:hypothetical protein